MRDYRRETRDDSSVILSEVEGSSEAMLNAVILGAKRRESMRFAILVSVALVQR